MKTKRYIFSVTRTISTTVEVKAGDVGMARAKAHAAATKIARKRWLEALDTNEFELELEEVTES